MPRKSIWVTGLVLTAVMLILTAIAPPLIKEVRFAVFDGYQRLSPRAYDPTQPVQIVDIDEASLQALGQWPWPRTYLAELTDRLFALGAVAVGFDILFVEGDRTSPDRVADSWGRFSDPSVTITGNVDAARHDAIFAAAMEGRPVVIAIAVAQDGSVPAPKGGIALTGDLPEGAVTGFPGALAPLDELQQVAAGVGVISLSSTADGVSRTVPMVAQLGDQLMPSFTAELLRVAQGAGSHVLRTSEASGEMSGGRARPVAMRTGAVTYPLDGNGHLRLHFTADDADRLTPAHSLLDTGNPEANRAAIAGKIILVGSSAQGLFDLRTTPLAGSVPGVTLQALALEQILSGHFLTRPDWMPGLELVLLAFAGLLITFLCTRDRPMVALVGICVIAAAASIGGTRLFSQAGLLFDPSMAIVTGFVVLLPGAALALIGKERLRQSIRSRFAYFVPETLVNEIAEDPGTALTPQGAARDITVMFIDMRRFSTVTEKMDPTDVVRLLNQYLGAVSDALVGQGATIDKYIGDAVMAFWNAPLEQVRHRERALRAIFDIEAAMQDANRTLQNAGLPPVGIGIGANTGSAFVGLMGSRDRLSYTAVGDSVTQAARFEGLTRIYGTTNCVGGRDIGRVARRFTRVGTGPCHRKGSNTGRPDFCGLPI